MVPSEHTRDLSGCACAAQGQVDAGKEREGSERGLERYALHHHRQRIVGEVLDQEGPHAQVEKGDKGGVQGDEDVQAGMKRLQMVPSQEEVEQS